MFNMVLKYMKENNMIVMGDRIVVGVSGGADSVCLFHILLEASKIYQLTLYVVHVNHGIRGMDADMDESYVKEICEKYNVPCTIVKANIPEYAANEGLSEEEAGRIIRYKAFYDCYEKNKCNKIAIAHNKNDNAETILFNLFRGSKIKGLTGIKAVRNEIIRPLLCVKRNEIEDYLNQKQIPYQNDKTNFMDLYSRNKIRLEILTYAKNEINNNVIEHIVDAGNYLKEIDRYLDKNIMKVFGEIVFCREKNKYEITIKELVKEDIVIQKGVIRKTFEKLVHHLKDIESTHIDLVLELVSKDVGKRLNMPYKIVAIKEYDKLILRLQTSNFEDELNSTEEVIKKLEEQTIDIPGVKYNSQIDKMVKTRIFEYKKNLIIPKNGYTKWFDYDKINNTVILRARNEGDYLQIDAKGSRKKIKSLFIDDKIPKEKRNLLPLVADGSHIMWVIGGRISEAYKVNEGTKMILEIILEEGKREEN